MTPSNVAANWVLMDQNVMLVQDISMATLTAKVDNLKKYTI